MMILQLLVWLSYILVFIFATTCLASGLIYLAELVEEYAFLTKKIIRYSILVVDTVHILMWLLEDVGTKEVLVGLAAHAVYYQLLREFPLVTLMSIKFIASVVLLLLNHGLWFWYFRENYLPFAQILSIFFLCVWLVPFAFFVSLSANENTLPYANPSIATATGEYTTSAKRGKTVGILLSIGCLFQEAEEATNLCRQNKTKIKISTHWIPRTKRGASKPKLS